MNIKKSSLLKVSLILILIAAIILASVFWISATKLPNELGYKDGIITYSDLKNDITDSIKSNNETAVISADSTKLFMNNEGTVSVEDSKGKRWNTVNNQTSFSSHAEESKSVFSIEYLLSNGKTEVMYSSAAIEKGQFRVFQIDNGVRVEYLLGESKNDEILPTVVEAERFEDKILSKVSNDDADFLKRRYLKYDLDEIEDEAEKKNLLIKYPSLKKNSLYVLSEVDNPRLRKKMVEMIKEAGYTKEDLAFDDKQNNIIGDKMPLTFLIAIEYKIENGELTVNIPNDSVKYYSDYPIINISLLKYFCSLENKDGYLFIPTGNGSIVNTKKEGNIPGVYTQNFYGMDKSVGEFDIPSVMQHEQTAAMPVYGYSGESESMFCIMENGEANSDLFIERIGNGAYAYPILHFISSDYSVINSTNKSIVSGSKQMQDDFKIRYIFSDHKTGYSEFAKYYRDYLLKNKIIEDKEIQNDPVLIAETVGTVKEIKNSNTVSLSSEDLILTSAEKQTEISEKLKSKSDNCVMILNGWNKGGLYSQSPGSVKINSKLYRKTLNDVNAYKSINLGYFYNNKVEKFDSDEYNAYFADKSMVSLKQRDPVQWINTDGIYNNEVISSSKFSTIAENYISNKNTLGNDIDVGFCGIDLNSDYNPKSYSDRGTAKHNVINALKNMKENDLRIIGKDAGVYALPFMELLTDISMNESVNNIIDACVPFKQMVLHGSIEYAMSIENRTVDSKGLLLKAIESGSGISCIFIGESPMKLADTQFGYLSSRVYDIHSEEVLSIYDELKKALSGLQNKQIVKHDILQKGVSVTEYEDGTKIYINFNAYDVEINNEVLKAQSYKRY